MTPSEALVFAVERRAAQMFAEDAEGLSIELIWNRMDECLRAAYRAAAERELETENA